MEIQATKLIFKYGEIKVKSQSTIENVAIQYTSPHEEYPISEG